jgi:uncharacterized membrane protein YphA (DoxX/SURF4 family)
METTWKSYRWQRTHNDLALDLIRIFLGVALFIRGALFLADRSVLMEYVQGQNIGWLLPVIMIHFITLAHLYGGLVMILGLLTRLAAFIQIPVLLGAIFVIHVRDGLMGGGQSLELSVLVLFLLGVVFWFGPGKLSLDYWFFIRQGAPDTAPPAFDPVVHEQEIQVRRRYIEEARRRAEQEHPIPVRTAASPALLAEPAVLDVPLRVPRVTLEQPKAVDPEAAQRLRLGIKYTTVFVFAFIMLLSMFLMQGITIAFTLEELSVVGGVVLLIFGMFFLFYRSAFQEATAEEEHEEALKETG